MINATNIDDILPTKLPGTNLTWRLTDGTEWGGKVLFQNKKLKVDWKQKI